MHSTSVSYNVNHFYLLPDPSDGFVDQLSFAWVSDPEQIAIESMAPARKGIHVLVVSAEANVRVDGHHVEEFRYYQNFCAIGEIRVYLFRLGKEF